MSLLFNITRPVDRTNYWNTFAGNIFLLLFSGTILLAALLFPLDRFPLRFCVFLHLTGFPCPTCGFTRAFYAFAHGKWLNGIYECPFALIIFIVTTVVFAYNVVIVLAGLFGFRVQRGLLLQFSSKKTALLAVLSFLLLLVTWIYRLIMGFK